MEGVVKNMSGQPISGAFVKLKNADRRLTFMVISQAHGRYKADRLLAGKYIVQGVGNGYQSEWSKPLDVAEGKTANVDLSLRSPQSPMLAPAWPARSPEEQLANLNLPDGEGKQMVSARCASCHEANRVARSRKDRDGWQRTITAMRENMKGAKLPDLTDEEAKTIVDYVATNFTLLPAPDPNSRLPRTLLKGEATKYRVVVYELEDTAAQTHDIAVDYDGNGWTNEIDGGKLGRLNAETLEFSEMTPPVSKAKHARPGHPAITASGVIWLPDGSAAERRWLSYDIKAAKWTSYDFPTTIRGGPSGNQMSFAPDGTIWMTGPGAARSFNPITKEWHSFDSPSWKQGPGGYGLTVASDGKVWFAENNVDRLARVDPATGTVDEFKIPTQGHPGSYPGATLYPRRLGADAEGNVWVGLWLAGKLLKVNSKTAEMTAYTPPSGELSGPYGASVDKKNNLVWTTLHRVDKLARFNPKTQEWLEYPLPEAQTDVREIGVDPSNPNRVWFSGAGDYYKGRALMGYLEVLDGKGK